MVTFVLILVLTWAGLVAVVWAGSLWFQAYIYSEPESELYWRAPAAGSALALVVALWAGLAYQDPPSYPPLWDLSPTDQMQFDDLQVQISPEEVRDYHLRKTAHGAPEYRDDLNRPLPTHPQEIIVEEGEEEPRVEHTFLPEMKDETHYNIQPGEGLQYTDELGRVMSEDRIGQLSIPRWDRFFANVGLYLGFLVVWFLSLWLLLRFQWTHALGLAVVLWLVMTVLVLPMLLSKVVELAQQPA